jgi:hypothetical protein
VPVGVYVTLHVAEAVVPDSVHAPLKVPVLLVARPTVPAGVMKAPGEMSVTVTVHVDAVATVTGDEQLMLVVVDLGLTTMLAVPVLPL